LCEKINAWSNLLSGRERDIAFEILQISRMGKSSGYLMIMQGTDDIHHLSLLLVCDLFGSN
jgi:hypothetical protein